MIRRDNCQGVEGLLVINTSCRAFVSSWIMSLPSPVSIDFSIEAGEVGADKLIGWTSGVDERAGSPLMIVSHFGSGDRGAGSVVNWGSSPGMLFGREIDSDLSVLHELMGTCGLCSISLSHPIGPLNVHTVVDQTAFDPTQPLKPQKVVVDRSEQCRHSWHLARNRIRLSNSEIFHHALTSVALHGKESQCR
jgi:hypothetical protein